MFGWAEGFPSGGKGFKFLHSSHEKSIDAEALRVVLQWLQDADLDPNDPDNASLVELRRLLDSTQVHLQQQPRFRLRTRDASYMAPPRRGARERQAHTRTRWGTASARSPTRKAVGALDAAAGADVARPKGRMEGGQQLVVALRIWQRRLYDQLAVQQGLQVELASAPPPPCAPLFPLYWKQMHAWSAYMYFCTVQKYCSANGWAWAVHGYDLTDVWRSRWSQCAIAAHPRPIWEMGVNKSARRRGSRVASYLEQICVRSGPISMCVCCRQVSDYVDELPYDPESSSLMEMVAAVLAPERRLAPRPRPQLQAAAPGAEPTLVVTVQQASNLAEALPEEAPRRTVEDGTRRRFATIATARRAAMVRLATGPASCACLGLPILCSARGLRGSWCPVSSCVYTSTKLRRQRDLPRPAKP